MQHHNELLTKIHRYNRMQKLTFSFYDYANCIEDKQSTKIFLLYRLLVKLGFHLVKGEEDINGG